MKNIGKRKGGRMTTGLIVIGILCLLYFIFALLVGMDFSLIWLAGAVFFAAAGAAGKYLSARDLHLPLLLKVGGGIGLGIILVVFLVIEAMIVGGMFQNGQKNLDYIIVLGAQVRGTVPSKALANRIGKAEEYLKANPRTKAVLSGGQGPGEDISEAQVMYDYLTRSGIEAERLIKEDRSTSTQENLEFSAAFIGKQARTGLLSQNFHIYRAVQLAEHQGYEDICGIAAKSEIIYQPHYMLREFFAVIKEKLVGNL